MNPARLPTIPETIDQLHAMIAQLQDRFRQQRAESDELYEALENLRAARCWLQREQIASDRKERHHWRADDSNNP